MYFNEKVHFHYNHCSKANKEYRFHHHNHGEFHDYTEAVTEYRKTFASKQDVLEHTPDPAVKALLTHMEDKGLKTIFDRFEEQKPQCSFGLAGVCCRNCSMGPCKVTKKSPQGVCGANADVIVARNLLRSLAAGVAAHGARGRETMLALKAAAEGKLEIPLAGKDKILKSATQFGIAVDGRKLEDIAVDLADTLLDDLSRTLPDAHKTLHAFATPERIKKWKELDILPISAYHEVFESLHRTSTGTDGDWRNIMKQFHRLGLAFAWTSVLASSIAMDSLFGLPERSTVKANVGAMREGYVNIAVHGHSPVLVSEIVKQGKSEEFIKLAKEHGAKGIQFYGICCSGLSAMYRYGGVTPLSNANGAELVVGTGALDLWVADVQDVLPSIMDVAKCFKTVVVTTSDSARLPGAEHYGYDHEHSNFHETESIARKIINRAIESYAGRREVPVYIPQYEADADIGFSLEFVLQRFGGIGKVVEAMRSGKIAGVVNLVGCNNPRVIYEKAIIEVAEKLMANNILVITNGCASFPLLKLGYCNKAATEKAGSGLKEFLSPDLPPVWHMGECLDNARASALFRALADGAGYDLKDMPFAFVSPEWSNEKGLGAALGFRLLGINSYHSVYPPAQGSERVMNYLFEETKDVIDSTMVVDIDHLRLANQIVADLQAKRKKLNWS